MSNRDFHPHTTRVHRGFGPRGTRRTAACLVLGALLLLETPRAEAAFGASPPWVRHSAVLVGTTLSQTVTYSTDEPENGSVFTYTESGCEPDLASWMTVTLDTGLQLRPGETGPWPAGQQRLPTVVHISVPADAAVGQRRCLLMAKLCAPGVDGGGVSICLGAAILVEVTVTDQPLVAYRTVRVTPFPNRVELGNPLHLELEVENTGNVDVTSLQMEARVWPHKLGSPYAGPYTAQGTNNVLTPPVPAYQSSPRAKREKTFPFTNLPVGEYYLGVTSHNQSGVDYSYDHYLQVYAPDGGVPDARPDANPADKNGPDLAAVDAARDAANLLDGGRVAMDVGAIDTARVDTPLGLGSTDARADATGSPDLARLDLANADRAITSLPDAGVTDAPIAVTPADATGVIPVDAAAQATVDSATTSLSDGAPAAVDTPTWVVRGGGAGDAGGSGMEAGHGSGAGGEGCSCHVGGGTRASAPTWLLVIGLFALTRLVSRRKQPGP